jgi:DivIVA domain-containing protein
VGTLLIYGLVAIVFAVALFLLATYFLPAGEQIAQPVRDEPMWALPAGRDLNPEDVETVRLPVALRGYRFAETDLLLDRLAEELKARDAEIDRLRGHRPSPKPADESARAEVVAEPTAEADLDGVDSGE